MDKPGHESRQRRIAKGVNQNELAVAVGRSQAWISLFENGSITPQQETIEKLFAAIDVLGKLKDKTLKARASQVSGKLAELRLPSRLEMANRPTARSK